MAKTQIEIPPKLIPVFTDAKAETIRYRGAFGGRGSGKTRTFALMTAIFAYRMAEARKSGVILCAREFMNSLDESSMEEVKQAIRSLPWLENYFEIGEKFIRTRNGRIKYAFAGLRHNVDSIKSKAKILLCWIDEAEGVSDTAYQKLLPTIREDGSECWITWNPESPESPTNKRFRVKPPPGCKIVEMNHGDNPFFPAVLETERLNDQTRLDPATYAHVWDGAYLENSDAQVLHGKVRVAEFEPNDDWDGPYYGADHGYAADPFAAVKCWIYDGSLYIEQEAVKVGLELDDTASFVIERMPGIEQHIIRADSARPESNSYLKRHGLPRIESVKKWPGSVEDGIKHLRSYYEIIVHPRCVETIRETRLYSYKVDRLSGDILPKVVDAHNHALDAARYALAPMIMNNDSRKRFEAMAS